MTTLAFFSYSIVWSLLIMILVIYSNIEDMVPMVPPLCLSEDNDEDDILAARTSPSNTHSNDTHSNTQASQQGQVSRLDSMYHRTAIWDNEDYYYEWRDELYTSNDQMFEEEMMDFQGIRQPAIIHDNEDDNSLE